MPRGTCTVASSLEHIFPSARPQSHCFYLHFAGKYVNHKGRNRHFTDVEELEQERKKAEQKKWRKKQEGADEEESSSEEEEASEKSEASGSGSYSVMC